VPITVSSLTTPAVTLLVLQEQRTPLLNNRCKPSCLQEGTVVLDY